MGLVAMPSSVRIQHIEWSLDRPAQVNRSPYSGARKVVANPWHGMWRGRAQLAPIVGEVNVRAWRAFLATLKGQVGTFLLPATEGPQHGLGELAASGSAAQGATSIALTTTAPELVVSGDGSSTTGWSDRSADFAGLTGAGTLSATGGKLRITRATGASAAVWGQSFPAVIGQTYSFSIDKPTFTDTTAAAFVGSGVGLTDYYNNTGSWPGSGPYTATFVATTSVIWVYISNNFGAGTGFVEFDNVSSKPILAASMPTLAAGMLATVSLPSGNQQLVAITLMKNAGLTMTFEPPLREAISSGALVNTDTPAAHVALADSAVGWSVDPGTLYGISFDVEEAF